MFGQQFTNIPPMFQGFGGAGGGAQGPSGGGNDLMKMMMMMMMMQQKGFNPFTKDTPLTSVAGGIGKLAKMLMMFGGGLPIPGMK